jgi:hypothetical protein
MKRKIDKSLEEVWEMKAIAREKFLNSGYSNYAEYLKTRQKKIDEMLTKIYEERISYITN